MTRTVPTAQTRALAAPPGAPPPLPPHPHPPRRPQIPRAAAALSGPALVSARSLGPHRPNPKAPGAGHRLTFCNPGPDVQDGEALLGDIRCDGVWERVKGRGAGRCEDVDGRLSLEDPGAWGPPSACREQSKSGTWTGRSCASIPRILRAMEV